MACYHPLIGVQPVKGAKIRFYPRSGFHEISMRNMFRDDFVTVPCGKCSGCLHDRANEWAVRCCLESLYHEDSIFVTLTYDDDHNPGRLIKADLQRFLKRLRKKVGQVRYFACGEYGARTFRPHFHLIIFGWSPSDKRLFRLTNMNDELYISDELRKLWPFGFHSIGEFNFKTASYVAKYVLGVNKNRCLSEDEFQTMSRRPGLGAQFFKDHLPERDQIIGAFGARHSVKLPRFAFQFLDEDVARSIKDDRAKKAVVLLRDLVFKHRVIQPEEARALKASVFEDQHPVRRLNYS